jgi:hypothetical protein
MQARVTFSYNAAFQTATKHCSYYRQLQTTGIESYTSRRSSSTNAPLSSLID